MPQTAAMPILIAPGNAAPPLAARSGTGSAQSAGAAGATPADPTAAPAAGLDSFAAVLGQFLLQEIEAAKLPAGIAPARLVAELIDAAALPAQPTDEAPDAEQSAGNDAIAASIAALLPMLQSLQPAAAIPSDAQPETADDAHPDLAGVLAASVPAQGGQRTSRELASQRATAQQPITQQSITQQSITQQPIVQQAEPQSETSAPAASSTDESGGAAQQKPGENRTAPVALAGGTANAVGKGTAANPAAAPLAIEAPVARAKPVEVPEASFANALASAQAPVQMHSSRTPLAVEAPVGSGKWETQVGEKLVWMVGHQEQRADLTLNPPQMGKVEVSISLNGDQASAQFVSANPAVRDALEAAMPRLREMFADAGITLGQAQVGSESAQNAAGDSANNRENSDNSRRGSGETVPAGALVGTANPWFRTGTGMVDVFA